MRRSLKILLAAMLLLIACGEQSLKPLDAGRDAAAVFDSALADGLVTIDSAVSVADSATADSKPAIDAASTDAALPADAMSKVDATLPVDATSKVDATLPVDATMTADSAVGRLCSPRGVDCGKGLYCMLKGCTASSGVCTVRPLGCPRVVNPVCGCDDKTYDNACLAAQAGVTVKSQGRCQATGGCLVTGCSGEICADRQVGSPCIWKPEFACYRTANCGRYGVNNSCAWEGTAALKQCLMGIKQCQPLIDSWPKAMDAARTCKAQTNGSPVSGHCAKSTNSSLECSLCPTYVTDTTGLDRIRKDFIALGCNKLDWGCPVVRCAQPKGVACKSGLCETIY
ncbi:MAG: hypothetical protein H6707_20130 [Deltaproteobacteria bacterium]|nr:hypothetical protein [Deltaproteobacteria bacterium]